ncbi:hypothetical protein TKK_0018813 [Trichogramma kaykai]
MVKVCLICKKEQSQANPGLSFHKFPNSPVIQKKWLCRACETTSVTINNKVICSNHFTDDDYLNKAGGQRRRLHQEAIPSRNLPPAWTICHEIVNNIVAGALLKTADAVVEIYNGEQWNNEMIENAGKRSVDDDSADVRPKKKIKLSQTEWLCESDFKDPNKWLMVKQLIDSKNNTIENLRRSNNYYKNKVSNCRKLVKTLKDNRWITDAGEEFIQRLPPGVKAMVNAILKRRTFTTFPEELKNFALSIHSYSPNAYEFLRTSFLKILPHPSTLRSWLKSIHQEPGISSESIATVIRLIQKSEEEGKKLVFNLTRDEMSIKKKIEWDGRRYIGYVDLGMADADNDSDDAPYATYALVYMLTYVNNYFKIPIAYYLTNSLSGQQNAEILKYTLNECFANGICICNITFDGAASNISMVQNLGANIYDTLDTASFVYLNKYKTYTTLDACHMIKLIRNCLASTDIIDANNKIISWRYIRALVDLQDREKIQVNFYNEKMKVFLAAQVLSESVARALEFCEVDLEFPEFEGSAESLESVKAVSTLQSRKTYGKMVSASKDVIQVCEVAETMFRAEKNFLKQNILEIMIARAMRQIDAKVFSTHHVYDQSPLADHRFQLIKSILKQYLNIKFHYRATCEQGNIDRIRMRYNKLTLFKNQ